MKIPDQARRASLLKLAGLAAAGWLLPQKAFAGRYRLTQTIDDRLRLEPFGPSDAAIMPFEITVGSGGKSTRQVVLIPSRQYRAIVALLEKSVPAGGTPSGKNDSAFQITRSRAPNQSTTYLASASQMRSIILLIQQGLHAARASGLPWLEAIKSGL